MKNIFGKYKFTFVEYQILSPFRIYFFEQIFEGNNPSTKTVKHELLRDVIPLYIRLNVKDSTSAYAGLRLELYGCKRKYIIIPVICSAVALSPGIRSTRQQIN